MTQNEIKEKIESNQQRMHELFFNQMFTLNKEYVALAAENLELQKQCKHEFKDGVCIYCGQEEKTNG